MPRYFACLFAFSVLMLLSLAGADDKKPLVTELPKLKPWEPADAVKSFEVKPGFEVKLIASEPLIRSPVAIDFDEFGRLFVAEFPEYNQYANPRGSTERGSIKILTDTNGDGQYDKATVFADNLDSPVALACWDGGLFVGIVPDLWYFRDTDGDGKADLRRKVITGFDRDKAGEAMLNSFRWGADNRFHIATGLAGGNLKLTSQPDAKPVTVRRQNIRFDPRNETFEPTSGGGQHGMSLSDWGDTFVCDNSNPIQHLNYDTRYTIRNPYVQSPSPVTDINAAGRYPNLNRISPPEPWREVRTRLRNQKLVPGSDEGGKPFGFFTGATGVTVYRGDAFPPEYRGNIFVGEVANNLVYRARLEPKGLGFTAIRAETDNKEFLASKDVWFRPVQFANGPDGCLYVVDMYRELIEGAAFLPPELLQHVNVAGGIDRGRIYRIQPRGFPDRKRESPGTMTTAALVQLLEHPNGWHRDTASRLIYQRQDRSAIEPLRQLARESSSSPGRMHARYALLGLQGLKPGDIELALKDAEPRAREHALRLAEEFGSVPAIRDRMLSLVEDPDPRVRLQLAFSLGALPAKSAVQALETLFQKDGQASLVRLAILCSAGENSSELFARILRNPTQRSSGTGKEFLTTLLGQIAAAGDLSATASVVPAINSLPASEQALSKTLIETLVRKTPASQRSRLSAALTGRSNAVLVDLLASARKSATNAKASAEERATALRTLGLAPFAEVKGILKDSLGVRQPTQVQLAALEVLGRFDQAEVPGMILAVWSGMSPQIRATAIESLLSRPAWVQEFLNAVEAGKVRPADLDPARVQLLIRSGDEKVRTRASKLFASATLSKRLDVINKYKPSLDLKGDVARGKDIFKNNCSVCHKLEGVGEMIGPDLASISNRGTEAVLTNILDPNREVLPQYYSYLLATDDGLSVTGMITAETANTVTLRKTDGSSVTVQRVNIESLRSTGLSAMPEGLEQKIDPQAMADLLAYLLSIR